MVHRTYYLESDCSKTIGENKLSSFIFRAADLKLHTQYNYATALTYDQRYFRLGTIYFNLVKSF